MPDGPVSKTLEVNMSSTNNTKLAYRSETDAPDREARLQFFAARNQALGRQRDEAQARLDTIRGDITSIVTACETGTSSDVERAIATIEKMRATEAKLVADVARLSSKIR